MNKNSSPPLSDTPQTSSTPPQAYGASAQNTSPEQEYKIVDGDFALKLLIVGLGVLLLVAAMTFIFLLMTVGIGGKKNQPGMSSSTETAEITPMTPAPLMPLNLIKLAPGEEITHMALGNGDLALHLHGPEGDRILIINSYTADQLSVIKVTN